MRMWLRAREGERWWWWSLCGQRGPGHGAALTESVVSSASSALGTGAASGSVCPRDVHSLPCCTSCTWVGPHRVSSAATPSCTSGTASQASRDPGRRSPRSTAGPSRGVSPGGRSWFPRAAWGRPGTGRSPAEPVAVRSRLLPPVPSPRPNRPSPRPKTQRRHFVWAAACSHGRGLACSRGIAHPQPGLRRRRRRPR